MALPSSIRQLQLPLLFLNNVIALAFKPGPFRIASSLPIAIILVSQTLYDKETVYFGDKYSGACAALALISLYVDWILLANPDKERWCKIPEPYDEAARDDQNAHHDVPKTFFTRLWWGLRLAPYQRYTGWSQQVKNVPSQLPHDYSKWLWIGRSIFRVACMFVLCDSLSAYTASTPHGAFRGHTNGKVPVGWDNEPLWYQIAFSWLHVAITYTSIEMYYLLASIPAVIFGLTSPRECPSMFGDLKEMYTVRKAWSVVWHQNCRRICTAPALFLIRDMLHLRKGSFASKYLQLFIGFFISAFVHGAAAMLCNCSFDDDWAFATFMAQAVAILIEDHVIDLARSSGLQTWLFWRIVGYVWVVVWFGLSLRAYVSVQIGHGMWVHRPMGNLLGLGPTISGTEK